MEKKTKMRALISVSDKSGVVNFAKELVELGYEIISTGGTYNKLKEEGIAREFVNRIQNLRKESGLEVTDKIKLEIKSNKEINKAVEKNLDYICSETLAKSLDLVENIHTRNKLKKLNKKINKMKNNNKEVQLSDFQSLPYPKKKISYISNLYNNKFYKISNYDENFEKYVKFSKIKLNFICFFLFYRQSLYIN